MKHFFFSKNLVLVTGLPVCLLAYHLLYQVDVAGLKWLLYPVQLLVSVFTSSGFVFDQELGYINEPAKIVINKSCAGLQFFITIIAFGVYLVNRSATTNLQKIKYGLLLLPGAYLLTLVANTSRIVCALLVQSFAVHSSLLKKPIVHEAIGILVYCSVILILYFIVTYYLKQVKTYEKTI